MSVQATKYGCLMLDLPINKWDVLQTAIKSEDLYTGEVGFGKELQPHTTILYGFHDNVDPHWIKDCVYTIKSPIQVQLNSITHFESQNFDVLKFDVESEKLHRLHEIFSKFPHTSNYDTYHPHVTIAYLKKGIGSKYNRELKKPIKLTSNIFIYSIPNGVTYKWENDKQIKVKRNKFYPSKTGYL